MDVALAAVYGMAGVAVDGNDVEAVFEVTRQARERALDGGGPTLIAASTMRMHGHGAHDDAPYVPTEQLELWAGRDPIERQQVRLRELGADVDALEAAVRAEVDAASTQALAMAPADPAGVLEGVFCESEPQVIGKGAAPWSGFAAA